MSELKNCPFCFGNYGNKEEKLCKGDCNNCLELSDRRDIIFCKKKKTFPCLTMCNCYKECSECYFEYFLKRKKGEYVNLKETIEKYIKKYNLKIKEFKNGQRKSNVYT
jgi:hypothetical protein